MDLERVISKLLLNLGISPSLLGYKYLKETIKLVYCDEKYLRGITLQLYPTVAKTFDTTASKVERGIRHAICRVFQNGNKELLNEIFFYVVSSKSGKTTNSDFISTIVEYIRLNEMVS